MRKTMQNTLPLSIVLAASLLILPQIVSSQDAQEFNILVIGDSHISGQGLRPENKFYSLVTDWIDKDVFAGSRKVNLKVKAHAGSRISLHPAELRAMQKAGDDVNKFHYSEANVSSPTIRRQIDAALLEYKDPAVVDLVMLSGCITDVLVADIVNPFYPERKLRERIGRFCGQAMLGLLKHAADAFPNAQIVVVGYFPIASTKSDIDGLVRYFSKIVGFPPEMQFFFTNAFSRQFLKILRNKIARRSRLWVRQSNMEIRNAMAEVNNGRRRVLFVESPISDDLSYGRKNSLLWEIGKNHLPNDETYGGRKINCGPVFKEMKYHHYGRLSTKMCELSSVAHPNVEGSRAFAEATKLILRANMFSNDANLARQ
jgi:hypothetical protein